MNWKNSIWLEQQYNSGLGTNNIAKLSGVSSSTICYYVKKFNINYLGKRHKKAIAKACLFCGKIFYTSECFSRVKLCSPHCSGKWVRMHKKPWNYGLNKYNDIRLLRMAEKKMGKVSWNKGLDAKTDFRVEKYAIRIKETKSKTIKGKTYEEIFGIEKAKIRRKQCASWIGRKHTEEEKKKIIESNKNRRITLKTKLKMRKSHVNAISSGKYGYTNTEPHKKIVAAIKQNNMWDGFLEEHPFEWMCIDIANPEIKLAIFVDGDYWHGNSARFPTLNEHQKRRIFIDRSQTSYLEKSGWKVLRFWESEINSNLDDCIAKIRGVKIAQNR